MFKRQVMAHILPSALDKQLPHIDAIYELPDFYLPLARLAMLLEEDQNLLATLQSMKLSNQQQKEVMASITYMPFIVSLGEDKADAMDLIDDIEKNTHKDFFLVKLHAYGQKRGLAPDKLQYLYDMETQHGDLRKSSLPLNGNELQHELALKPGKLLGKLLTELTRQFRYGKWQTKAQGLELAKKLLK